jgi:rSAM/selenodomain-associated transferase 2
MKLSIIVPVLNEAAAIQDTLKSLQDLRQSGHEVIVVDGGSEDDTVQLAGKLADSVVRSKAGRGRQMNQGVRSAQGDTYLFLHADTLLPPDVDKILATLPKESEFWGRFDVRLSGKNWYCRVIEWLINKRSRISRIATGDQAIFVSKNLFHDVNGYPEIALMEDIAISKLLNKLCKPYCLRHKVVSSSRRWEEKGIVRTILKMWKLRFMYTFGADPDELSRDYE